jgi:hypothetical protein
MAITTAIPIIKNPTFLFFIISLSHNQHLPIHYSDLLIYKHS